MNTAFIGYGAISSVFMAHAWASNRPFSLITRTAEEVELQVELAHQSCQFKPLTYPISQAGIFDLIIVCIKAYQVNDFVEQVSPFIAPHTTLVFVNNGLGIIELIKNKLPNQPVIIGTTSVAALKSSSTQIVQTGKGKTDLGWINSSHSHIAQGDIDPFFISPTWHDDVLIPLWMKLAANAVINPITAYHQQPNGIILEEQNQQIAKRLCQEIAQVMNMQGYASDADSLLTFVNQIATNTKHNHSSMNRDIHFKRPTEIEFINGYICQLAQKSGIETPENTRWYQCIKDLESRNKKQR